MKAILKITTLTVNRGEVTFTISQDAKGKFFSHELGQLTQWAKVFGTGECKAHRINPTKRVGNQYGTFLKQKPFTSISQATEAIFNHAKLAVRYF